MPGSATIKISVSSAGFEGGNFARISINNSRILVKMNENGHCRGMHIAIINPQNGKIETAQVFDTYKNCD